MRSGARRDDAITWPKNAPILIEDEYEDLASRYRKLGVELHPTTSGAMVDKDALLLMADAASDAIKRVPALATVDGHRVTLMLDARMPAQDYAYISRKRPWIIHLNADAMKSLEMLSSEFARDVERGWFAGSPTAASIIYHELGHNLETIYTIDARQIASSVLGVEDDDELASALQRSLSGYAAYRMDEEIVSEVFSAWMSRKGNQFAEAFMRIVLAPA